MVNVQIKDAYSINIDVWVTRGTPREDAIKLIQEILSGATSYEERLGKPLDAVIFVDDPDKNDITNEVLR